MGVMGGSIIKGSVLVAEEVKQSLRPGTTGLADVICSATKHPRTCLLLLMYKYTCMSIGVSLHVLCLCWPPRAGTALLHCFIVLNYITALCLCMRLLRLTDLATG